MRKRGSLLFDELFTFYLSFLLAYRNSSKGVCFSFELINSLHERHIYLFPTHKPIVRF